jgi:hypothetical protein
LIGRAGYEAVICGGVFRRGFSDNDLDVELWPIRNDADIRVFLLDPPRLVIYQDDERTDYHQLFLHDGRTVDIYVRSRPRGIKKFDPAHA